MQVAPTRQLFATPRQRVRLIVSVLGFRLLFLTQLDRGLELGEPCLELADTGIGGFLVGLFEVVEELDDLKKADEEASKPRISELEAKVAELEAAIKLRQEQKAESKDGDD